MPINSDDSQFVSFSVSNEIAAMLAARIDKLNESGIKASRSELIRAVLTRTNLDRAERDIARSKKTRT